MSARKPKTAPEISGAEPAEVTKPSEPPEATPPPEPAAKPAKAHVRTTVGVEVGGVVTRLKAWPKKS